MKTIFTILAATFSLAAYAADMPSFDDVDQNKDGAISQAEASKIEGLDFAALDTNNDGSLDREEYQQNS